MKKVINNVMGAILLVFFLFCHSKNSVAPKNGSNHPQVDIAWPSLADSPWPISHGNVQRTGRSPFCGPREGVVEWEFTEEGMRIETGSPVIGEDGTIYFMDDYRLYAINPDGTLKWKFDPARQLESTPMIGAGDIIYFGAGGRSGSPGAIYALNNDGSVKWEFPVSAPIFCRSGVMGLDGTLYFVDKSGTMYALNPEGTLKWTSFGRNGFYGGFNASISISPDGATLYTVGLDSTMAAIDAQTAQLIWQFKTGYVLSSGALVDNDGNIYCYGLSDKKRYVVSLHPDGSLRWKSEIKELEYLDHLSDMHLDKDGNIYVCTWGDKQIISVDYQGNLRWIKDTQLFPPRSPILGDSRGEIFVAFQDDHLKSLKQNGDEVFHCIFSNTLFLINGAISGDGHLYVCSRLKLICIK